MEFIASARPFRNGIIGGRFSLLDEIGGDCALDRYDFHGGHGRCLRPRRDGDVLHIEVVVIRADRIVFIPVVVQPCIFVDAGEQKVFLKRCAILTAEDAGRPKRHALRRKDVQIAHARRREKRKRADHDAGDDEHQCAHDIQHGSPRRMDAHVFSFFACRGFSLHWLTPLPVMIPYSAHACKWATRSDFASSFSFREEKGTVLLFFLEEKKSSPKRNRTPFSCA